MKVFISSTSKDLRNDSLIHLENPVPNYYKELKKELEKLDFQVIGMESLGNSDQLPKDASLKMIDECEIFIGIYAYRYGSILDGDKSITEQEYDYSKKKKKLSLYYIVDNNYNVWLPEIILENYNRQIGFKEKILKQNTITNFFTTSDSLSKLVISDIRRTELPQNTIKAKEEENLLKFYLNKMHSFYSKIQTISGTPIKGFRQDQFPIHSIYLPLSFSSKKEPFYDEENEGSDHKNIPLSSLDGQEIPNRQNVPNETEDEYRSIGYYLKSYKKIFVLGTLGQGKSVLCNWLITALTEIKQNISDWKDIEDSPTLEELKLIPIILRGKGLSKEKMPSTLKDFIKSSLLSNHIEPSKIEDLANLLSKRAENGQLLLIVDGLDEIRNISLVKDFSERFQEISNANPDAYFLVTSRINNYKEVQYRIGNGYKHIIVDEFDNTKQYALVQKFSKAYNLPTDTADKILGNFNENYTNAFLKTPLILTNVFLLYAEKKKIPKTVQELYEAVFELMFERVPEAQKKVKFLDSKFRRFFGWFGYFLMQKNQREFSDRDFNIQIKNYLKFADIEMHPFYLNGLLNYLANKVGIFSLIKRDYENGEVLNFYEFRHKTYQEFLAGLAMALQSYPTFSGEETKEIIDNHIDTFQELSFFYNQKEVNYLSVDSKWFEPIKFYLNILNKRFTEEIILYLIENKQELEQSKNEARRLFTAKLVLNSEFEFSIDIIRKVYLSILLDLNELDSCNIGSPKSIRDQIIKEFNESKWYKSIYPWVIEKLESIYKDDITSYFMFFIVSAYPNQEWLDNEKNASNPLHELIIKYNSDHINGTLYGKEDIEKLLNIYKTGNQLEKLLSIIILKNPFYSSLNENDEAIKALKPFYSTFLKMLEETEELNIQYHLIIIIYFLSKIDQTLEKYITKLYDKNQASKVKFTKTQVSIGQKLYKKAKQFKNNFYRLNFEEKLSFFSNDKQKSTDYLIHNLQCYNSSSLANFIFPYMINLDSDVLDALLTKMQKSKNSDVVSFGNKIQTYKKESRIHDEIIYNSRLGTNYKVTGKDITGEVAWYFIYVPKRNVKKFLVHKSGDSYNLEDYGKIVKSGYGKEVPEDVKDMLRKKYGFDHF